MKDTVKKLMHILNRRQKIVMGIMAVLILIGGVLETLGVSAILPVINGILEPEALMENEYVQIADGFFQWETPAECIQFLLIGVILIFILKNAYLLFLQYIQAKVVNNYQSKTISYMLEEYLNRPYEYYLNADIPTIFRTIDGDVPKVFSVLMEFIKLLTEAVVSVCLIITILIVDAKMAVTVAAVMFVMSALVVVGLKPVLHKLGKKAQDLQSQMGKWRLQSIYGIKDVKILNKEHYFAGSFAKHSEKNADLMTRYSVLNNMPRMLIETTGVCAIMFYLALCLAGGEDLSGMVAQIGAFGVAAIRLLPSVNRISTYMTNIAFFEPSLTYVYENVDFTSYKIKGIYERPVKENAPDLTFQKEIRMEDITYIYPETDKKILDKANMVIPFGKSVGIMGPSGSGKTTAVDILLGMLRAKSGRILCDGVDVFENYEQWLAHIGYIPQSIFLTDDSIRENIAFGVAREDIDDARIWAVLKEAQLKEFVEQMPEGIYTPIGERGVRLSGGQRQRLGIARALYHDPEILVFDEATSALDNDTETAIMEAIDSFHGRKTLIIIAHRLRTIENCDIIYKVDEKKIEATKL